MSCSSDNAVKSSTAASALPEPSTNVSMVNKTFACQWRTKWHVLLLMDLCMEIGCPWLSMR
ncbi:MAG TPA: hypothetical protein PK261_06640, partial [Accumulibacter sp.]|nr:hypothetical protein [Accumulibacter sp.]